MRFTIVDGCPVPAKLAPAIERIKQRTGATLNSCDRSPAAEPLLAGLGKKSQRQLYEGWLRRLPGFNPANPPGRSTHERRNDGVAYLGPAGLPLRYWQVGMDWSNAQGVVQAAKQEGFTATVTYPGNPRESHHVNFRREPRLRPLFRALREGSRGRRVVDLTRRLSYVRSPFPPHAPYLDGKRSVFDGETTRALKRFQAEHHQAPDGVYGPQSHRQLQASVRFRKRRDAQRKRDREQAAADAAKRPPQRATSLSQPGLDLIAGFEGFRADPYNDQADNATVGFGHLLHHGPVTAADRANWSALSRERALEMLRQDATAAERAVLDAVKVPLTQPQLDALVSFTFNVGAGALRSSTLLKRLNAGEHAAVPAELARWTKAGGRELPGLVARRHAEARLYQAKE